MLLLCHTILQNLYTANWSLKSEHYFYHVTMSCRYRKQRKFVMCFKYSNTSSSINSCAWHTSSFVQTDNLKKKKNSSPPQQPMTSDFEGFSIPDFIHLIHLFSYLNSWERASIFPFECSVLNKGTIFITSLVRRGPWLGIEPNTSLTRSQHSTTRL